MVLRLVFEALKLVCAFIAITAGDGIADEFDLSCRQGGGVHQSTTLVEHEAPELREELVALDDIHQSDGMTGVGQGSRYGYH